MRVYILNERVEAAAAAAAVAAEVGAAFHVVCAGNVTIY